MNRGAACAARLAETRRLGQPRPQQMTEEPHGKAATTLTQITVCARRELPHRV